MKYSVPEHQSVYRQIKEARLEQWNDLFDQDSHWTYDHFQNKAFLNWVLNEYSLQPQNTRVLEYGCGTGPAACFLASLDFDVRAFDLVPDAIDIARNMANDRGLEVKFEVADVCDLSPDTHVERYGLILDSYCLQSVVTDEDRQNLFQTVHGLLAPDGVYVISTAMYSPDRVIDDDSHYDSATGILYNPADPSLDVRERVMLGGKSYIPHRRHLNETALRQELDLAGFRIIHFSISDSADVVCVRR